jgi:prepilin-type N-terminal cleavage/methylation domain-containing protein
MKRISTKQGFTLIEVILVLAIAAMIFLMVLLTLPAVQRAQRDMQRKEDVGKIIAAYTEFLGNNRGTSPRFTTNGVCWGSGENANATDCDLDPYIKLTTDVSYTINDVSGSLSATDYDPGKGTTPNATTDNIAVYKSARCGVNGNLIAGNSARQIAVVVQLEGSGNASSGDGTIFYCQES